jgi:peptide/nickel transport system ATP-binding protein
VTPEPVLSVERLVIEVARTGARVVDDVSLTVGPGEVLGLAGESGCGKTTLSLALLGYTRRGLDAASGRVRVGDRSLLEMSEEALEHERGSLVTYVPQDPASALNPALRVGTQLEEVISFHRRNENRAGRRALVTKVLEDVGLPTTRSLLESYPHQLSGGQQQRIAIAIAIVNRPRLIVMDEPTTGLDVTTQARVLQTIRDVCREHGGGVVYVTHDLAVVSSLAIRVAVMYAGRLAEVGRADQVLQRPAHPYVRGLLQAVPDIEGRRELTGIPGQAPDPGLPLAQCLFAPRCPLAVPECRQAIPPPVAVGEGHRAWCIRAAESAGAGVAAAPGVPSRGLAGDDGGALLAIDDLHAGYGSRPVLHGISLSIATGDSLALVGESGSGKTTLARCIAGLHTEYSGTISLTGAQLAGAARARPAAAREAIQYVFQNPYSSLNPRRSIEQSIAQPLHYTEEHPDRSEIDRRVGRALDSVSLSAAVRRRFPHELSGGQRQRVAIARALIVEPRLLVCDEVTSALDVSVQAVVIELLDELRRRRGLSMLFVTHNLALVHSVADEIAVIQEGRIVERGPVGRVLARPTSEATRTLVANVPRLAPVASGAG